jgi:hypothetical protein
MSGAHLEARLRDQDEHPVMVAHLSKYRSLMPSLALIFDVSDWVVTGTFGAVNLEPTQRAAAWCDYIEAPRPAYLPRRYRSRRHHHPPARRKDQSEEALNAIHGSRCISTGMGGIDRTGGRDKRARGARRFGLAQG